MDTINIVSSLNSASIANQRRNSSNLDCRSDGSIDSGPFRTDALRPDLSKAWFTRDLDGRLVLNSNEFQEFKAPIVSNISNETVLLVATSPFIPLVLVSTNNGCVVYRGIVHGHSMVFKLLSSNNESELGKIESSILRQQMVNSPNVVTVQDYAYDYNIDRLAIMMEYAGEELSSFSPLSKPSQLPMAIDIALQIARGLVDIHGAGIVHGSISPSNVFFDSSTRVAKIGDFSVSSSSHPPYMSPEQLSRQNMSSDYRTDLYSLGVTLYELLTGNNPFCYEDSASSLWKHLTIIPIHVNEILLHVPPCLSQVIGKLLEKSPGNRYQSANGLKFDLEQISAHLHDDKFLKSFEIALVDFSEKLLISQMFVGRKLEKERILESYRQVSQSGQLECVFVAGDSGCGKTRLMVEMSLAIARLKGVFISGKFALGAEDLDYSAFFAAVSELVVDYLSTFQPSEINAISAQLGDHIDVLSILIQDVNLMFKRPNVAVHVPEDEIPSRVQIALRELLNSVASSRKRPLVLFLDDLQWIDASSASLLESLLLGSDLRNVMFVGSYRPGEVGIDHPCAVLIHKLSTSATKPLTVLRLEALDEADVKEMVQDTLKMDNEDVDVLSKTIFQKCLGNAFAMKSAIDRYYRCGLIVRHKDHWDWNIKKMKALDFDEHIVHEVASRIKELGDTRFNVLSVCACCGRGRTCTDFLIEKTLNMSSIEVEKGLCYLLENSLIVSSSGGVYSCAHDGILEAVLSSIGNERRMNLHLDIGRVLFSSLNRVDVAVEHFDGCEFLVNDNAERLVIAKACLSAAKSAMSRGLFAKTKKYLNAGTAYYRLYIRRFSAAEAAEENRDDRDDGDDGDDGAEFCLVGSEQWKSTYELWFNLHSSLLLIQYYLSELYEAENTANYVRKNVLNDFDNAIVGKTLVNIYTLQGKYDKAIEVALKCAKMLDFEVSPISDAEVLEECKILIADISEGIEKFGIESVFTEPKKKNPKVQLIISLLSHAAVALAVVDSPLTNVLPMRICRLSLEHGVYPGATRDMCNLALVVGHFANEYVLGNTMAMRGIEIASLSGSTRWLSKSLVMYAIFVSHWTRPLSKTLIDNERGFELGIISGDNQFGGFALVFSSLIPSYYGCDIVSLAQRTRKTVDYFRRKTNDIALQAISALDIMIGTILSYDNSEELVFQSDLFPDEETFLSGAKDCRFGLAMYYSFKAKVLFLFGFYEESYFNSEYALNEVQLRTQLMGFFQVSEHILYHCLTMIALWESSSDERKVEFRRRSEEDIELMSIWAKNCPCNFLHRFELARAEFAFRIAKDYWDAFHSYSVALESARSNCFLLDEAVICERYALFCLDREKVSFSRDYFEKAARLYSMMNIDSKTEQIAKKFERYSPTLAPVVRVLEGSSSSTPSGGQDLLSPDLESTTEAISTFSKRMDTKDLLTSAMNLILKYSRGNRGVFLLIKDSNAFVEAICESEGVQTLLNLPLDECSDICCVEIVQNCIRARSSVSVRNAATHSVFSQSKYCQQHKSKSIFCYPVMNQGSMLGVFYLESDEVTGAFAGNLPDMLYLISVQLILSIEMAASLRYANDVKAKLEKSERMFRLLAEFAPAGIIYMDEDYQPIFMNDRYTEITGVGMENFTERWNKIIHPNHVDALNARILRYVEEKKMYSMEIQVNNRVDGSGKWIVFSMQPIGHVGEKPTNHICTVSDISEQKLLNATIPPSIVKKMLREPRFSRANHVQLAPKAVVMFADIVGFTKLSDLILPSELFVQLNSVYTEFDELIRKFELTRLKIIGDCYMVIGSVVDEDEDSLIKMAKLAVRMRESAYNKKLAGHRVLLRIGLHMGPLACGIIGADGRVAFDVWGRTVNSAKRLQEDADIDTISVMADIGDILANDMCVGPSIVQNIQDIGTVQCKEILGDKDSLDSIQSALLTHLCELFPDEVNDPDRRERLNQIESRVHENFFDRSNKVVSNDYDVSMLKRFISFEDVFEPLMNIDGSKDVNQSLGGGGELSLLMISTILGCSVAVRRALYLLADTNTLFRGWNALIISIIFCDIDVIHLLCKDVSMSQKGPCGLRAISVACIMGRIDVVKHLLEGDSSSLVPSDFTDDDFSPVVLSAVYGNEEMVRLLIRNKFEFPKVNPIVSYPEALRKIPSFLPHPPQVCDSDKKLMSWLLYRNSPRPEIVPNPFECERDVLIDDLAIRCLFLDDYEVPTLVITTGKNSLMIDCNPMAFATIARYPSISLRNLNFAITNCVGSNGKGLEPFVFESYFSSSGVGRPKLYINKRFVEPLWVGSLMGGVCTFEGLEPTLYSLFDVHESEDLDSFVWEGLRFWFIPSSSSSSESLYSMILLSFAGKYVLINPDPNFDTDRVVSMYEKADLSLANISYHNCISSDEKLLSNRVKRIGPQEKIAAFCTCPDQQVLSTHSVSNVCEQFSDFLSVSRSFVLITNARRTAHLNTADSFLRFVGAGNAFSAQNCNAELAIDGHRLLIDVGGSWWHCSQKLDFRPLDVEGVFISHLHADHCAGLADLVLARKAHDHCSKTTAPKLKLYIDEKLLNVGFAKKIWENCLQTPLTMGIDPNMCMEDYFDIFSLGEKGKFDWYGVSLEILKTEHVLDHEQIVPSSGLMMTIEISESPAFGSKILYSADTKNVMDLKYCNSADLIFHDCSFLCSPVHCGFETLNQLPRSITHKMWLMHAEDKNPGFDTSSFRGVVYGGDLFPILSLEPYQVVVGDSTPKM